jgi:hypothetical protein
MQGPRFKPRPPQKKKRKINQKAKEWSIDDGSSKVYELRRNCYSREQQDGKLKKKKGKAPKVIQVVPAVVKSQSMVSGVQVIFDDEGSVVLVTPIVLMGYFPRKKADVEHLLRVDKEARITFTLADGRVVDRMVVLEEVDVAKRVIRGRN